MGGIIMKKIEQQPQEAKKLNKIQQHLIPPQYQNLPSEIVEELWQPKIYADPEKTKAEKLRRQKALEQIEQREFHREEEKEKHFQQIYSNLPPERKKEFADLQAESTQQIGSHLGGKDKITDLSKEEAIVLGKMKEAYEYAQSKNPEQPFQIQFSRPIDQAVYNNLIRRLSWEGLKNKINISEEDQLKQIKQQIDNNQPINKPNQPEKLTTDNQEALTQLKLAFEEAIKNKQYRRHLPWDIYDDIKNENNRQRICEVLMKQIYQNLRNADYKLNIEEYKKAYELATTDKSLSSKMESDWVYRGLTPDKKKGEKTVTRGSLNINVSPEVVNELDELIKKGLIKANYKFGELSTQAAADSRHDAITIYFLENPSPEALAALSKLAQKHFRGNNLLGKKISEGFYMSEVESISDTEAENLIQQLQSIDSNLMTAVKDHLSSRPDARGKKRIAMSEAQYYAVKKTLETFGLDINYDKTKGFLINKI